MLKKLNFIYLSISIHYNISPLIFITMQTYTFFFHGMNCSKKYGSKMQLIFHSDKNMTTFTFNKGLTKTL